MTITRSTYIVQMALFFHFVMAEQHSIIYMHQSSLSIFLLMGRLLPSLALVNSAAVNMRVHVSFQTTFFSGYMSKSGITMTSGSSTFSF